jgi:hypothetical protein
LARQADAHRRERIAADPGTRHGGEPAIECADRRNGALLTASVRLADRRLDRAAGGRDVLAVASTSTTVHRSGCALLEGRDELTPAGPGGPGLTACRLCNPTG